MNNYRYAIYGGDDENNRRPDPYNDILVGAGVGNNADWPNEDQLNKNEILREIFFKKAKRGLRLYRKKDGVRLY